MTRPPESFLELADLLGYVSQVVGRGIPGAVWVRAELSSVTDRRHLYLDVVQSEDGQEVAKARATLWARERYSLEGKFRKATGGTLKAGMKVLMYVTAEFHPQYGFSLHILDLAPEFTVGDQAIKLDNIRRVLDAEGLLTRNRSLPPPDDFSCVAVISPRQAAGLDDFTREANRLQGAGVTEFLYLQATFQGREAPASLISALSGALLAHLESPLDALVIIRGGGAQADLAWLNDLELARMVARFPVPVITGIGHARDDSILDELACVRTDTPSKAAAYIVGTAANAAGRALEAYRQIRAGAREVLRGAEDSSGWMNSRVLRAGQSRVSTEAERLNRTMQGILGLTPERTLGRGYALVRASGGGVVTRAEQVGLGETLTLEFGDGQVQVRAEDASA